MTNLDMAIIEGLGDLLAEHRAEVQKLIDGEIALLRAEMLAAVAEARADLAQKMIATIKAMELSLASVDADVALALRERPN
jgi:hypothetical protein